ncbi:MAG: FUSC family protein [Thermomicrobiales bacterium]
MRKIGAGERVIKTAFAAALAWQIGSLIPGVPSPYLAPLGAMLVMQATIADSLAAASQRLLGVVVGVVVALLLLQMIGLNAWSIGLAVMLALMIGRLFRLGPAAVSQVAVTTLLVVALGGDASIGFGWHRIIETIIGIVVGVAINALFAPPSFLGEARSAAADHANALAEVLARTADSIREGIHPETAVSVLAEARASDRVLRSAQAALVRTETAHQFNYWARGEQPDVARLALQVRTLERVGVQCRGVIRTIEESVARAAPAVPEWLEAGAFDGELVTLIDLVSSAIRGFPEAMAAATGAVPSSYTDALADSARLRTLVATDGEAMSLPSRSGEWVQLGSVLADLDRIRRELQSSIEVNVAPAPLPPPTAPYD